MTSKILIASAVAAIALSPFAAMAQDRTVPAESTSAAKKLAAPSTGAMQGRSEATGTTKSTKMTGPTTKSDMKAVGTGAGQ